MRYAIVSDIHANKTAWQAVVADIADLRVDKIICLGDVVGYGPDPVAVMESVYRHVQVTVAGNHDAAVCGKLDMEAAGFSERAKAAVRLHRKMLSPTAMVWLGKLPYLYEADGFACAHGDFSRPERFNYIIEPATAMPSWAARKEQLLFVGHTHLPGVYVIGASGKPHLVEPCDFEMEAGKRYIVNPGSVGYPRVGQGRTSYCVYDSVTRSIRFRQLPFDIEGYKAAMRALGVEDDGWIIEREQQLSSLDVRDETPAFGLNTGMSVKKKWFVAAGAVVFAAAGLGMWKGYPALTRGRETVAGENPAEEPAVVAALPLLQKGGFLSAWPAVLDSSGDGIPGWRCVLGDKTKQRLDSKGGNLVISSPVHGHIQMDSALVDLAGTGLEAVRASCIAKAGDDFEGTVSCGVVEYAALEGGGYEQVKTAQYELRPKHRDDGLWLETSRKVVLLRSATHIRFVFSGEFKGQIELSSPFLGEDGKQ
jgi:predicted phosphodiesterase